MSDFFDWLKSLPPNPPLSPQQFAAACAGAPNMADKSKVDEAALVRKIGARGGL